MISKLTPEHTKQVSKLSVLACILLVCGGARSGQRELLRVRNFREVSAGTADGPLDVIFPILEAVCSSKVYMSWPCWHLVDCLIAFHTYNELHVPSDFFNVIYWLWLYEILRFNSFLYYKLRVPRDVFFSFFIVIYWLQLFTIWYF